MAKVNSPISSNRGASVNNTVAPRIFHVNDASAENQAPRGRGQFEIPEGAVEISSEQVNEIRAKLFAKKEKQQEVAVDHMKIRVEILTGIGRRAKDVYMDSEEGPICFSIRTLKGMERVEVAQLVENLPKETKDNQVLLYGTGLYQLRVCTLKHSLFAIDNVDINMILGTATKSYEEQVNTKENFIHSLDDLFTTYLYNNYEKLMRETYDGYAKMPVTDTELKETAEAISKSGTNT